MRSVVWFRGKDLRTRDHPALHRALATSSELVPVFVLSPEYFAGPDAAARAPHRLQFLLDSLEELAARIAELGSRLVVLSGPARHAIPELAAQVRADRVFAIGACEPDAKARDAAVAAALRIPLELSSWACIIPNQWSISMPRVSASCCWPPST